MTRSILVAEDSPTQSQMICTVLRREGYEVAAARDGQEALEMARANPPDLIVSDVTMPRLSGYEFCRELRASDDLREIPFILLTERSLPEDIMKGLFFGADNFITKPYKDAYLLERIGRIFENLKLREGGHLQFEVALTWEGRPMRITADRQQIMELLFATSEQLGMVNTQMRESRDVMAEYTNKLKAQIEALTGEVAALTEALAYARAANGLDHRPGAESAPDQ